MKKVYLPALILCLMASAAHAQKATKKFSWGYKIGLNFSNLRIKNLGGGPAVDPMRLESSDWKTGLATGLFFNVRLCDKLSLQPELLYSSMGGSNAYGGNDSRLRLNYFSLPVTAKYKLFKRLSVLAGPQIDLLINAKDKSGGELSTISNQFRDYSFNATGGISFWPTSAFDLTARYIFGFTNINTGSFYEMKNGGVQLTAGLKL